MKLSTSIITLLLGINLVPIAHADDTEKVKNLEKRVEELEREIASQRKGNPPAVERNAAPARPEQQKKDATSDAQSGAASPFKVADFVTGIRLQNDLRIRYDAVYPPDDGFVTRWRIRPRLRLGAIASLKDDFEIGFRLVSSPSVGASSGGDPLSTNQTFEDNASRKPVAIDWAFARWTPIHGPKWGGSVTIGKMENPPNYTENVFDVDYTPEGLAEQFSYKVNGSHTLTGYFGQYVLDEEQFNGNNPLLFVHQLHLESKWTARMSSLVTVSGLRVVHPESLTTTNVPDSNHGNTRNANGVLLNQYRLLIADGGIVYTLESFPFYRGPFPIRFSADYLHNNGADNNNIGYSFGPTFGRVSQTGRNQTGDWEFSYRYQELQGDANYEELTASDNGAFYRSRPIGEPYGTFRPTFLNGLNLRGHAFRLAYAPFDSMVIDARVWRNRAIKVANPGDNPVGTRVLFDLVWKF